LLINNIAWTLLHCMHKSTLKKCTNPKKNHYKLSYVTQFITCTFITSHCKLAPPLLVDTPSWCFGSRLWYHKFYSVYSSVHWFVISFLLHVQHQHIHIHLKGTKYLYMPQSYNYILNGQFSVRMAKKHKISYPCKNAVINFTMMNHRWQNLISLHVKYL